MRFILIPTTFALLSGCGPAVTDLPEPAPWASIDTLDTPVEWATHRMGDVVMTDSVWFVSHRQDATVFVYDPASNRLEAVVGPGRGPYELLSPPALARGGDTLHLHDTFGRKWIRYDMRTRQFLSESTLDATVNGVMIGVRSVATGPTILLRTLERTAAGGPSRYHLVAYSVADGRRDTLLTYQDRIVRLRDETTRSEHAFDYPAVSRLLPLVRDGRLLAFESNTLTAPGLYAGGFPFTTDPGAYRAAYRSTVAAWAPESEQAAIIERFDQALAASGYEQDALFDAVVLGDRLLVYRLLTAQPRYLVVDLTTGIPYLRGSERPMRPLASRGGTIVWLAEASDGAQWLVRTEE